jgi:hypothetical protein
MSLFRKRDIAVIAAILITAYITLDNNSFSYMFEPAWYVDQREFSSSIGRPILPIISDLDGNGEKEIVLITKGLELKVSSNGLSLFES